MVCCSVLSTLSFVNQYGSTRYNVCCSLLQCAAVWYKLYPLSTSADLLVCKLQCVAACYSVLQTLSFINHLSTNANMQFKATHCYTLQHANLMQHENLSCVLQCVTVCCWALQSVAECCRVFQSVAVCCSVLLILSATNQCEFTRCDVCVSVLQIVEVSCSELQFVPKSILYRTRIYNSGQRITTHCNMQIHCNLQI